MLDEVVAQSIVESGVMSILAAAVFSAALGSSVSLLAQEPPEPPSTAAPMVDPNSAFADPSQPIKVHLNKMFMIALDANPSTGYHWVQHGDLDKTVLKYLSSFFLAPQTNLAGAPGHEIRMYWAEGLGDTTIDLDYVAPGSSGTVGKSVEFTVSVVP